MAYLIYTDTRNLAKSLSFKLIRIPRGSYNEGFSTITRDEKIYLYNYEDTLLYGPLVCSSSNVIKEKNPRKGPFNGLGKSSSHYFYESVKVEVDQYLPRGIPVSRVGLTLGSVKGNCLKLDSSNVNKIEERLYIENHPMIPLIIEMKLNEGVLTSTIIKVEKGAVINTHSFIVDRAIVSYLQHEITRATTFLKITDHTRFLATMKKIGKSLYSSLFLTMKLAYLFSSGKYNVNFILDKYLYNLPLELAYKGCFLFEKNIVSYREQNSNGNPSSVTNRIERILIFVDPLHRFRWAIHEGETIYNFFVEKGIACDFISRPISSAQFIEQLLTHDAIHISGHLATNNGRNFLELGKDLFNFESLAHIEKVPSFMFLSTCGNSLDHGFNFLNAGGKNIVLSRWNIPDSDFSDFILDFYELWIDRVEIGKVYQRALVNTYRRKNFLSLAFILMGEGTTIYEIGNTG